MGHVLKQRKSTEENQTAAAIKSSSNRRSLSNWKITLEHRRPVKFQLPSPRHYFTKNTLTSASKHRKLTKLNNYVKPIFTNQMALFVINVWKVRFVWFYICTFSKMRSATKHRALHQHSNICILYTDVLISYTFICLFVCFCSIYFFFIFFLCLKYSSEYTLPLYNLYFVYLYIYILYYLTKTVHIPWPEAALNNKATYYAGSAGSFLV